MIFKSIDVFPKLLLKQKHCQVNKSSGGTTTWKLLQCIDCILHGLVLGDTDQIFLTVTSMKTANNGEIKVCNSRSREKYNSVL